MELAKKGLPREVAYQVVQRNAMAVWQGQGTLQELLSADEDVKKRLTSEELDEAFDLKRQMQYVDMIYKRVFDP